MSETIFDLILQKKIPSYVVAESDTHLAFLTPFAICKGQTVVIPKTNFGDDIFELDNSEYIALLEFSKLVSLKLKKSLNVERVAMVVEGTGVAYVHVKLYPLHGNIDEIMKKVSNSDNNVGEYSDKYLGYLSTKDGPMLSAESLKETASEINS